MSSEKWIPHLVSADDDGLIFVETQGPIDADLARVLARFARVRWAKQGERERWQADGHGGHKLVIRAMLYDPVPLREGAGRLWYCLLKLNDVKYTVVVEIPENMPPAAASDLVGDVWVDILLNCDGSGHPWVYDEERCSGWLLTTKVMRKVGSNL